VRIVTEGEGEDPKEFEVDEDLGDFYTVEDEEEQGRRKEQNISVVDIVRAFPRRIPVDRKKPSQNVVIELDEESEKEQGQAQEDKETGKEKEKERPLAQKKPVAHKKTRKAKK
jgi:hypothetical protein